MVIKHHILLCVADLSQKCSPMSNSLKNVMSNSFSVMYFMSNIAKSTHILKKIQMFFLQNPMKSGAKLFTMKSLEQWQQTTNKSERQLVPILQDRDSFTPIYRSMTTKLPNLGRLASKFPSPSTGIKIEPGLLSTTDIKIEHLDGEFWPTIPAGKSKTEIQDLLRKGLDFELETLDMQDRLKRLHINERMPPPACRCIKYGESK